MEYKKIIVHGHLIFKVGSKVDSKNILYWRVFLKYSYGQGSRLTTFLLFDAYGIVAHVPIIKDHLSKKAFYYGF
jgi:hypothetical protein